MKQLIAIAVAASLPALASTWDIEEGHATANFAAKHMMLTDVKGKLGKVTGTIELDDKDVSKSKVDATIDATALSTQLEKRDQHLKSPDFLDVQKYPTLAFKSKKVEKGAGDNKLKITGDLTIKGVTKEVVLDTELTPEVVNPFTKAATRAAVATTTINREDYGLVWNVPLANNGLLVSKDVRVALDLEFTKREVAPKAEPAKKK